MFNNLFAQKGGYPNPVVAANFRTVSSTPSWIDNSGTTGNRMICDSTGTLTWAPANMLLQSNTLNTSWTASNVTLTGSQTDPNNGSTAWLLTAGAANATLKQGVTTLAQTYIFSVWLKRSSGTGTINLSCDGTTWTAVTITSSWARYSVTATVAAGTSNPGIQIVTNGDVIVAYGAQYEAVTYQTSPRAYISTTSAAVYQPRYDYDASTASAMPLGMLIEVSSTNYATYSHDISNGAWTSTGLLGWGSGSTVNATTAPDGTTAADLITEDGTNTQHRVYRQLNGGTFAANTALSFSFFIKRATGTRNVFVIAQVGGDLIYMRANLGTGAVIQSGSGGTGVLNQATCQVVGSFYRITLSGIPSTTTGGPYVQIYINNSSTADGAGPPVYTGDSTSGLYVWGAQVELGSFATSYIPTTSASVTRVADVVKLSGSALTTVDANTGSVVVQTTKLIVAPTSVTDILSSATTRRLIYSNSSNTAVSSTDGTTNLSATIGGSGTFSGGAVRSAIAWNSSGRSIVANAGTVATDSVNLSTASATTIGGYSTTISLNGWIGSMALYNIRLSDAVLKSKSAVGAAY